MQRTQVPFLGREDLLEKDMATHALILALAIPRSEEPRGIHGGHKRVGHNLATKQQQERQHSCLAVLASTAEKNESAIHTHISPPFWVWVFLPLVPVFTFFFLMILMYFFVFACAGSSLLQGLFASCGKWGLCSSSSVQASHWSGFPRCRAQSVLTQTWYWCRTSLVAPRHVGILPDQGSTSCLLHW